MSVGLLYRYIVGASESIVNIITHGEHYNFVQSEFRKHFEAKGRFNDYLAKIPTYLVTESDPGLIGAARYLIQKQKV